MKTVSFQIYLRQWSGEKERGNTMKKIAALSLAALMALNLAGCSQPAKQAPAAGGAESKTEAEVTAGELKEEKEEQPESKAEERSASADMPKFVNVIGGPTGGMYYPAGIAIAEIFTNELGIQATAQVTGGAAENPTLVHELSGECSITMTSAAYAAYNGQAPYEEAYTDVLGWFNNLSTGAQQLVTLEDSGINSIADIKGKKIAMGPAGNGGIDLLQGLMEEHGFSLDDCETTYVSFADGLSALKDGAVDVAMVQSAPPASAIVEFAVTCDNFKIISVEKEIAEAYIEKNPYYSYFTIDASVYGTSEGASIMGVPVMGIISESLSEEVVYEMTKALFENIDTVTSCHAAVSGFSLENAATGLPIPLHPGAEKYFREVGLIS